ncbi:hypothetical protein KFK09_005010 [Dendrobium nobile]|uniref:RecQ-mediated genome instability protein 1 n=1 Tax=Dendrobium nobile TaxID=94219 RepID=A0A8T3BZS8_DENNO|nr:hypothetical protein KFK09_005010 [Dendrobium nobile]
MRRRTLRLPSSSDEDEAPPWPQTVNTSNTNHRRSPPPPQNAPLEISEDEFVDVEDALSDHSSPPVSVQNAGLTSDRVETSAGDPSDASAGPIDEFLRRVGLALRREWLASCLSNFVRAVPGFEGFDMASKARMCFEQFLSADMNYCGAGILPENVHCMNTIELEGPFVLQVDEVTNISCRLRERYHDSPASLKRCLKLSLSDGVQHVFGMEYRPIHDLEVLSLAGFKIIIRNVQIRRGLLLLLPEVVEVLGGMVEDLDAARQRLVNEVNKPPRGKRKQALLPLCQRATLAAWPSNTVNNNETNSSESYISNNVSRANISMPSTLSNPRLVQDVRITSVTVTETPYVKENVDPSTTRRDSTEDLISQDLGRNLYEGFSHANESIAEGPNNYESRLNAESNIATDVAEHVQDVYAMDEDDTINEFKNPSMLTGDAEIPFTYLACLLAQWIIVKDRTSFIQGRIKCILTGVKRFQFKHRSTYELLVYVDDGSYISEVFIDHNGTVLLEISKDSPLPVVLQMSQGCSASDGLLLLRRLKSFTSRHPQNCSIEPIVLSP